MSLFASDERQAACRFLLHHVWFIPSLRPFLHIAAPVDPARPVFPCIAAKYPAANWFEREAMDLFGLVPEGHPNPARVAGRVIGAVHAARPLIGELLEVARRIFDNHLVNTRGMLRELQRETRRG